MHSLDTELGTEVNGCRRLADLAIRDVLEDARELLRLNEQLQTTSENETREDLQVELEVQVTAMRVHAQSAEEAIEAYADALPDD